MPFDIIEIITVIPYESVLINYYHTAYYVYN